VIITAIFAERKSGSIAKVFIMHKKIVFITFYGVSVFSAALAGYQFHAYQQGAQMKSFFNVQSPSTAEAGASSQGFFDIGVDDKKSGK
jgi:hypothetical protein